ncbi:MAG: aldose 1-epimerase family protein [Clostridia bacterium]|nr:aldose 1-epimerase family protein [Clostridia bacterium]
MEFIISKGEAVAKCTSVGGELTSFVKNGTEYVWYGNAEHWSGQAPCLFPVVCRAKEDRVIIDGKSYPMKKHGFARKAAFSPIEVTPSSVTFRLTESDETKECYPFDFNLDITHSVTEDGFTTEYKVTNKSDEDMVFCIGGHPGFNCPVFEGESFEDYSLVFDNAEGAVAHNCDLDAGGYMSPDMPELDYIKDGRFDLHYNCFDFDAVVVENLPVKKVNLVNRNTGHGVRFEFDSFDAIGFWTPIKMASPFICLEPWNGLPGGTDETPEFTSKKYAKIIAPGESFVTSYTATVI